jgi:hypothetical protein
VQDGREQSLFGRSQRLSDSESHEPTSDIVVFYPGDSLKEQVGAWVDRHPECSLEVSFARSLPGIRVALRNAAVALLDATEDPAQATDAFSQAVARLGAHSVAVYTETMHEWLELFVRIRGALLLFGPLDNTQWEELFERMLRSGRGLRESGTMRRRPGEAGKISLRPEEIRLLEKLREQRLPAGVCRPRTGVK